jgi:hypothetical protein
MSGTQAVRAIRSSAPHLLDESAAVWIVRQFAVGHPNEPETSENLDDLMVQPDLLSIVCHQLDERRKSLGRAAIDEVVIGDLPPGGLLADFYQHALEKVPAPTRRFIENELVTASGVRTSYPLSDALRLHGVREQDVRQLIDRRLLSIVWKRGTQWIELSHDLLVFNVVRSREERRNQWSVFS